MKKFKQFITEKFEPPTTPPPTVVYPKNFSPEMIHPSEEGVKSQLSLNLPPGIDWNHLNQLIDRFYELYSMLLALMYAQITAGENQNAYAAINEMTDGINEVVRQINLLIARFYPNMPPLGIPLKVTSPDPYAHSGQILKGLVRWMNERFNQMYPNATAQQISTFNQRMQEAERRMNELRRWYNTFPPTDFERYNEYGPQYDDWSWGPDVIPQNLPKKPTFNPFQNLSPQYRWPGHADGVVG
jgi:hypothetical protein